VTTLANGARSTITSYTLVPAKATGGGSPATTTSGSASLQTGTAAKALPAGKVGVIGGLLAGIAGAAIVAF